MKTNLFLSNLKGHLLYTRKYLLVSWHWYEKERNWPNCHRLANGCCLLLAGSLADFLGNRVINLIGCFLLAAFILACGVAETGIQLIMFRTLQGIATSMCLPTAFSIMTDTMPAGKRRNIGFACLGLGQPLGFSVGLVLGGIFQDSTLGWRFGYYLCAGATFILTLVNFFKLPKDQPREPFTLRRLRVEVDWIGIILSSACLGIISYVFSWDHANFASSVQPNAQANIVYRNITDNPATIRSAENLALLCIAIAMIPAFWGWMEFRERSGKPALIPNSLWRNTSFTTICVMVLFSWAVLNGMETIMSLLWVFSST